MLVIFDELTAYSQRYLINDDDYQIHYNNQRKYSIIEFERL